MPYGSNQRKHKSNQGYAANLRRPDSIIGMNQ